MRKPKTTEYFEREKGAPNPVVVRLQRRVHFREVDIMGIAWHGRYPGFFEECSSELRDVCGLSNGELFNADLRAPIVKFHAEYHQSLFLDEDFTIQAALIWSEAAKLNIEYKLIKQNGAIAASGFTVQVFTDGTTGELLIVSPDLLEGCRQRWKNGEFPCQP